MTISAKFPPLGINILEKILVELKIANKKESIGMFFVFLAIFHARAKFLGYKTLISSFLEILLIGIDEGHQQELIYAIIYQF